MSFRMLNRIGSVRYKYHARPRGCLPGIDGFVQGAFPARQSRFNDDDVAPRLPIATAIVVIATMRDIDFALSRGGRHRSEVLRQEPQKIGVVYDNS